MSKVTEAWHYIAILGKACAYLDGEVRLESGLGTKDFGHQAAGQGAVTAHLRVLRLLSQKYLRGLGVSWGYR